MRPEGRTSRKRKNWRGEERGKQEKGTSALRGWRLARQGTVKSALNRYLQKNKLYPKGVAIMIVSFWIRDWCSYYWLISICQRPLNEVCINRADRGRVLNHVSPVLRQGFRQTPQHASLWLTQGLDKDISTHKAETGYDAVVILVLVMWLGYQYPYPQLTIQAQSTNAPESLDKLEAFPFHSGAHPSPAEMNYSHSRFMQLSYLIFSMYIPPHRSTNRFQEEKEAQPTEGISSSSPACVFFLDENIAY